jgi:hypothetical protein
MHWFKFSMHPTLGMGSRWLTTISSMRSVSRLNGLSSTWQQQTCDRQQTQQQGFNNGVRRVPRLQAE